MYACYVYDACIMCMYVCACARASANVCTRVRVYGSISRAKSAALRYLESAGRRTDQLWA